MAFLNLFFYVHSKYTVEIGEMFHEEPVIIVEYLSYSDVGE